MFASGKTAAVASATNYIEDVFSTYLYTGNGSTQTITNGIDLSTKGGLVWIKNRTGAQGHNLYDTARGRDYLLRSNSTAAQAGPSGSTNDLTSFNTNGFSLGTEQYSNTNDSAFTYASWTFRKQPKFFDVVTFTSNGSGGGTFNHSLGSTPGCVILKSTGVASSWIVYHRSTGVSKYLELQSTAAEQTGTNWISVDSTSVTVGSGWLGANRSIVAYLFAHDAGGFGLTGTDNVITCGSFTTDGSGNATVNLGYEPQWVLVKNRDVGSNWYIADTMRGFTANSFLGISRLYPNLSAAEDEASDIYLTSTGFAAAQGSGPNTYIYIAIRRGPMKVPTTGTSVFSPLAVNNALNTVNTTGFPIDLQWYGNRDGNANNIATVDRLRGVSANTTQQQNYLRTASTAAEVTTGGSNFTKNWGNTGFWTASAQDGANAAYWNFRRAPNFFDEVCYTGDGNSNRTVTHNLGVSPEIIFLKTRSAVNRNWRTWTATLASGTSLYLNLTDAATTEADRISSANSTTFTLSSGSAGINGSGDTYVAYLFATCAGVSKVGSYTGNGSTQTINCGFTGGARFVLIKRTDSTGNWYVYDTARGMTTLTDPYLLLNSTAAETATLGSVTTVSTGFALNASILAAINTNGASYIFLAIS